LRAATLFPHSAFDWCHESIRPPGVRTCYDIYRLQRFAKRSNNIVHWSEFDRGGHLAKMEQPVVLIDDLRTFFRRLRSACVRLRCVAPSLSVWPVEHSRVRWSWYGAGFTAVQRRRWRREVG
jgi:hypothetical protein